MNSYRDRIDQVVMQIFADLGIEAGAPLMLDRLKSEWARLHRRNDQLIDSVRRLIFSGALEVGHGETGTTLVLTHAGYQRASALRDDIRRIWNLWTPFADEASVPEARYPAAPPA